MERAQRARTPLSLIIFDIDYFKEYNDQWGHPAGDARLKAIADTVKLNLRKYDIAARYGGDEFAVIMTNCDQADAINFAQRLRQGIRNGAPMKKFDDDIQPGYTLSIGVATYPQDASTSNELLLSADNAALRAKQQGKDCIKTASDYETT
jgi:diguanylate cyclase (GGDEF)-like protein